MLKATTTVREVRNKDSGVDLMVTGFREVPGLLRASHEFQVVVVSTLQIFKLPSHRPTDTVQFTLYKKLGDFEDLRSRLNEAFSGTALPLINKKSIIVSDAVIKERRNSLDAFVKFLASTPRIVTSKDVLTFLGVDSLRAGRFARGETDDAANAEAGDGDSQTAATHLEEADGAEESARANLFADDDNDDEEEEEGDFFTGDADSSVETSISSNSANLKLFESQDLKRELTEDDEKDFAFIPDAIITKKEVVKVAAEGENDDLFNIDEDIDMDKLLLAEGDGGTKQRDIGAQSLSTEKPSLSQKPVTSQKPTAPRKPAVSPKPSSKPSVPTKPAVAPRPTVPSKPEPAAKPTPAPRKLKPASSAPKAGGAVKAEPSPPSLSSDDIMTYIAANAAEDDADLDLFS